MNFRGTPNTWYILLDTGCILVEEGIDAFGVREYNSSGYRWTIVPVAHGLWGTRRAVYRTRAARSAP